MAQDDPNEKFYFDPLGEKEWITVFNSLTTEKLSIMLWLKSNEEEVYNWTPKGYIPGSKHFALVPEKTKMFAKTSEEEIVGKKVLFRADYDKFKYFGEIEIQKENKEIFFVYKGSFYKSQQRGSSRIEASPEINLSFLYKDEDYMGCDCSSSGISFFAPISMKEEFAQGKILENFSITVTTKAIVIQEAKVVKTEITTKSDGSEEMRVAVFFTKIVPYMEKNLFQHMAMTVRRLQMMQDSLKK